jgi:hypothetical protein
MVSTGSVLRYLFPDAVPLVDYVVQSGQIADWNLPEPQPTPAQIAAAMLPAAQSLVSERIKAERDRRKFEGVTVGPNRFHSDADSRTQQIGLVLMGANLPQVQWKTMGGSFVTMTPTLAQQIFGATAARDIAVFAVAEAHIAAVNLLEDADAVMAYDYTTGWPG